MNLYLLYLFLFLHWFADFLCQPHYVAVNKSKSVWVLLLHVLMYTILLALGTVWLVPQSTPLYKDPWAMWLGANAILHLATDAFTSKISSRLWQEQRWHSFFSMIGFDQLLHVFAILATTQIFLASPPQP